MYWPFSLFSSQQEAETESDELEESPPALQVDLLRHYEVSGVPLPPSARVGDPSLKQRESQPIRLWHLWKLSLLIAVKATEITADVISHQIWGPRRKSWGIEMTLLSSIMRGAGRHSHLVDIATIRLLMSIGGMVPLPSDALVTPLTFRVRKRKLRGILADFDAAEDGTRELSGEWVVGKRTWRRLQAEWKATQAGRSSLEKEEAHGSWSVPSKKERVILYLHGGAYYLFSPATHRLLTIPLAKYLDARLFAVDYRLAPETRFPGPLHDAVSTYFRMIEDLHIPPENIIVAGDSAGGGLCLALLMYLRDNEYPLPAGAILMSPWVDLTLSCDSWDSNAPFDVVPMPQPGDHMNPIACYLGEHMEKYLTHPYASPLFGDFHGLPPLLIQAGDAEVLRDEITLLAHKATLAGVVVRHELYEDAIHVFQSFPFIEAAGRAFVSARDFAWNVLPDAQLGPRVLGGTVEKHLEHEIGGKSTRLVRGDGTEVVSGWEGMEDPTSGTYHSKLGISRAASRASISSQHPSHHAESSWGTPWPSPPASDSEDDGPPPTVRPKLRQRRSSVSYDQRRDEEHSKPVLRRLRSTLSFIVDASTARSRRASYVQPQRTHIPVSEGAYLYPHSRFAAANMYPSNEPVPRPSIRRTRSSNADITSLCEQWVNSGPANQTTTFKPDVRTRRRAHTRTGSQSMWSGKNL